MSQQKPPILHHIPTYIGPAMSWGEIANKYMVSIRNLKDMLSATERAHLKIALSNRFKNKSTVYPAAINDIWQELGRW